MSRRSVVLLVSVLALAAALGANGGSASSGTVGVRAARAAVREVGVRYEWGGDRPSTGFDASGLVEWAYRVEGVQLPHLAPALWGAGRPVARRSLRAGDLVFFNGHAHVGIYVGSNRFVHAPHTGAAVRIDSLVSGFYARHYSGAVRISSS